jgi:glutaredoxin
MNECVLYIVDSCPYCNKAIELLEDYAKDVNLNYEIVNLETEIVPHPEDPTLVKRSWVLYNKDRTEKFEFPAVPALWIKEKNELVIGVGAIDYLKKVRV